jgi:hypothetical protein
MSILEEYSDVQVDSYKNMEFNEYLTLRYLNKELLDSPSELQQLVTLLSLKFNLVIIFIQHLIKLSTKLQNLDSDLVVNFHVEVSL